MSEQACKDFLRGLYTQYIQIKISQLEDPEDATRARDAIIKAMDMINHINKHIEHDADIYKTYTSMELFKVFSSIRSSVKTAKVTAEELGFISAIENNLEMIIDCAQYYLGVELQLLNELGFKNPRDALNETINEVKTRKQELLSTAREQSVSGQLNKVVDKIANIEERLSKTAKFPERKDKPKQETVKAELRSAQSYMTTKQDNNSNNNSNSNVNPFAAGTALWQSLMTYWLNAYGEFFKNAPKMTEE